MVDELPDELINYERAFDLVREKAFRGKAYAEGQKFVDSRDAMELLPPVGGRSLQSLGPDVFDGDNALNEAKANMGSLREEREARFGPSRRKKS